MALPVYGSVVKPNLFAMYPRSLISERPKEHLEAFIFNLTAIKRSKTSCR